jgi:signal-transduction protein with cAMP-binding, CBS, and nucleotidyltransferase domain
VVEKDGALAGIVEAHDLLKIEPLDHHFKMRELARQDYMLAYPEEAVDQVNRDMLLKNIENVVVVQSYGSRKPIGIARANDIPQLRRWLMEEETREVVASITVPRSAALSIATRDGETPRVSLKTCNFA